MKLASKCVACGKTDELSRSGFTTTVRGSAVPVPDVPGVTAEAGPRRSCHVVMDARKGVDGVWRSPIKCVRCGAVWTEETGDVYR